MPPFEFIQGESLRVLDERSRIVIPQDLSDRLTIDSRRCILAKERPGALSLWSADWEGRLDRGLDVVTAKMRDERLRDRLEDVQLLGRLLATRHANVELDKNRRLTIPESFRAFLQVEPASSVMVVWAAVCVEIWQVEAWIEHLHQRMPAFRQLLDELSQ